MRFYVLFIKRKFALDNMPEAYACCDEQTVDENPDWMDEQVRRMLVDTGTDMHGGMYRWVTFNADAEAVDRAFNPAPVAARVCE